MHHIYLVHSTHHETRETRLALTFSRIRAVQLKRLAQKNAPGELDVSISLGLVEFGSLALIGVEVLDRLLRLVRRSLKVIKTVPKIPS